MALEAWSTAPALLSAAVGRSRLLVILVGAMLAGLCLPTAALAGSFRWALPANFTASSPGANPDLDSYGAAPWRYLEGPASLPLVAHSHNPSRFSPLPQFATGIRGGLAGWTDSAAPDALVATNPSNASLTDGIDTFPAGQLVITPPSSRPVAIRWTSPLSHSATVNITGAITPADPNGCASRFTWSLVDQAGNSIQSGTSADTAVSAAPTVPAGGAVYLIVDTNGLMIGYDAHCATATATLQITAAESAGPQVTLDSPAHGALISGGQPSFSGSASTAVGSSPTVTVRIYRGSTATGSPLQTLSATRSESGGYTVGPNADLTDGQYTAQAEQDDLAAPVDVGLSAPSTFTVHNAPPVITLKSLGTKPLRDATPSLAGVAGRASGDSRTVVLAVYPGSTTNATPVRYLSGSVDSRGHFSITVTTALPDGRYTAVAAQSGALSVGLSRPMTFRIKVHAPVVTVTRPVRGSSASRTALSFSGSAGTALGDSSLVTLLVYAGSKPHGQVLGTVRTRVRGGAWTARLTFEPKLGLYTAVAKQSDDAGHTGVSPGDTFLVVSGPTVVGATVKLSPSGMVSVPITCLAPAGQVCSGTVLILTEQSLQPLPGGPAGPVRLLFAYVSISGGKTELVGRPMRADVARVVRRRGAVRVRVTANLTGGPQASAIRSLRLAR